MQEPGSSVSILGLGVSGLESALFLQRRGYKVFVSELKDSPETRGWAQKLEAQFIEYELGRHTEEKILGSDWVLVSPGISPFTPLIQKLIEKKKPVLSEIETASWFSPSRKVIAITGAAGKTTTTELIASLFRNQGKRVISCGNIGNPWIGEIDRITPDDLVVLEVSSFQLFYSPSFRPWVGILLNISPNHLDWHRSMEHYVESKLGMLKHQTQEDFAILRRCDQKKYFPSASLKANVSFYDEEVEGSAQEKILGVLARLCGITKEQVSETLARFPGIEHRLEPAGTVQGVQFINDSKCTTPLSLAYALERFPDHRVILLAGGKAKSQDFDTLRLLLSCKVKQAYVFGESREMIYHAWKGSCPVAKVATLHQALDQAFLAARPGDAVILSPACASFDQFKNYQDRGQQFKSKVQQLAAQQTAV